MFQSTLRPSSGYSVLALWETASGSMLRSHHLLGKVCAEWVEHIYYIVITVLVFNSLAWWRGVDGRGYNYTIYNMFHPFRTHLTKWMMRYQHRSRRSLP